MRRLYLVVIAAAVIAAAGRLAWGVGEEEPQVPPEYTTASAQIRTAGREITALAAAGDGPALFGRFGEELRAVLSEADLQAGLDSMRGAAALGPRREEGVWPAGPDIGLYRADHQWGEHVLALYVVLGRGDTILLLEIAPRTPLPPDPLGEYVTAAELRLPFDGDWWVIWGGDTPLRNYHVVAPDQRHACDFAVWKQGATYQGDGTRNDQYWAWGQPVRAPGRATVVAARDGVNDNRPRAQVANPADPAGNHVILDVGGGEYMVIAHFQQGSVRVKRGDVVEVGQMLGLCGNSGNSSEPHVHIHLQDRPQLFGAARGLRLPFRHYRADGERVERVEPQQGQFIRDLGEGGGG